MAKQENKFALQLTPADKVTFASPELGVKPTNVTLKLKNTTSDRQAFKVKCTSNALFKIRPPVGAVEAGSTADIQLTFTTPNDKEPIPDSGRHYFAVYHIKAPKADEKPRDSWTNHKGNADGEKRLSVDFKKDAAAAAADGKPAEDKKPADAKKDEPKKEEAKKEASVASKPAEKEKDGAKDEDKKAGDDKEKKDGDDKDKKGGEDKDKKGEDKKAGDDKEKKGGDDDKDKKGDDDKGDDDEGSE